MLAAARLLTLCLLASSSKQTGLDASLVPGSPIKGELAASAPSTDGPAQTVNYRIQLDEAQPVTIELRSYAFDAYLVLRDASGAILAEDDDGLTRSQARIVIGDPVPDAVYTLQVRASGQGHGEFELLMRSGKPRELTRGEALIASLRDVTRGLKVLEAKYGPVHESLLPLLDELGDIYDRIGRLEDALGTYGRALVLRMELLGDEDPETVESMNVVGLAHKDFGNFDQAAEMLETVLAIRLETVGSRHADTATSQENLGILYRQEGRLDEAERLCSQAARTLERLGGEEHFETLVAKSNLAHTMQARGKYGQAQELFEQVLEIRERVLGADHLRTGMTLHNLATLLHDRGQFREGAILQERALEILKKELGPEHPDVANALNNLATLRDSLGDSVGARPLFERALEIQQARLGESNVMSATTLQNLAVLLASQGLLDEGLGVMHRSIAMFREQLPPDHIQIAAALGNLGSILKDQGAHEAALTTLREALRIAECSEDPGFVRVTILSNMTSSLRATGKAEEAREAARETLELSRAVLGPDHVITARNMSNLMVQLEGPDRIELGIQLLERALEISDRELEPGHIQRVTCRTNLASLHADRGDLEAAWETVASSSFEDLRRILATATEEQSYRLLANRFWQLELEQTYASVATDPGIHTLSFERVLNWKGQLASFLHVSRRQLHSSLTGVQRDELASLQALQGELSKMAFDTILDPDERADRIGDLLERRRELELRALSSIEAVGQASVSLAEVRRALPDKAALVEFTLCRGYLPEKKPSGAQLQRSLNREYHVLAWVLAPDGESPVPVDLGPAREMATHVDAFLSQLRAGRVGADPDHNERLRALLWDPLAPHLSGASMVFISPDGFLGSLPFGAISLADGSYLLEHKAFVYSQNLAGLATLGQASPAVNGALLCVGGVDFGEAGVPVLATATDVRQGRAIRSGAPMSSWNDLPYSSEEVRSLSTLHAGLTSGGARCILLEGALANEERIKRELPGKGIVHFATHGFFQPDGVLSRWDEARAAVPTRPLGNEQAPERLVGMHPGLLSGLVCAGANLRQSADRDDGYLTAEEIGWLDLDGLNLVVLSACETGLGVARSGEGFIGLRRAFASAGARTVICSLWSVEDESTRDLMGSFYEGLWERGLGKLEALRAAQLEMLARNRRLRRGAKPETWAGFVLSGDWR